MKSVFHELGNDDSKARALLLESLDICAHDHILSRKLLHRFSAATGPMYAIIGDWFDLEQMENYDHTILPPPGSASYSPGDYPRDRLVSFVSEYLQNTPNGVIVSENWGARRKDLAKWAWFPPRIACYGDNEVYHIVTPDVTDPDQIQAAVMASHHWQTNVCSSCMHVPEGDIPDEGFLDELVQNTMHIFIPAFDGSGYLIWSPHS